RHRTPEIVELLPRAVDAAANEAVGQRDRIHGAGAGAGHRWHVDADILQQPVEHAPGESPMRAAALQRDVDLLGFLRLAVLRHGVPVSVWSLLPYPARESGGFDCSGLMLQCSI